MKGTEYTNYSFCTSPWDSELLGVPSGLVVSNVGNHTERQGRGIEECVEEATSMGVRFLTIKFPSEHLTDLNFVLGRGGKILDAELTFYSETGKMKKNSGDSHVSFEIQKSFWDDSLSELADDLGYSRFFMDDRIPEDKARLLWQTSIKNHCLGRASYTVIAKVEGTVAGILCVNEEKDVSDLFIVGVLRRFRGRSIGKQMIRYYMERIGPQIKQLTVETQSSNHPAIRLYQSAGYRLLKVKYITHLWL